MSYTDDSELNYTPEEQAIVDALDERMRREKWSAVQYCAEFYRLLPRFRAIDLQDVPSDSKEEIVSNDFSEDELDSKIVLKARDKDFTLTLRDCLLSKVIIEDYRKGQKEFSFDINPHAALFIVEYLQERQGRLPNFGPKSRQTKDWFMKPYADKYWFYREIKRKTKEDVFKTMVLEDFKDTTQAELDSFFSKDQDWNLQYAFSIVFVANHLGIQSLVDFCMSWVGYKFKGNTPGEIRVMMDIDEKHAQMCIRARKNAKKLPDGTLEDDMTELKEAGLENDRLTKAMLNELYSLVLEDDDKFADYYKMWKVFDMTPGQIDRDFNKISQ